MLGSCDAPLLPESMIGIAIQHQQGLCVAFAVDLDARRWRCAAWRRELLLVSTMPVSVERYDMKSRPFTAMSFSSRPGDRVGAFAARKLARASRLCHHDRLRRLSDLQDNIARKVKLARQDLDTGVSKFLNPGAETVSL